MKIGILTYHDGLNHGAYLQAFALMRVLGGMGHDVEIINYKNRVHHHMEDVRPWFKYRRPFRFIDRIKKQRAFSLDHKQMKMSRFSTDPNELKKSSYDVLVVGSDVVWNYKIFGYDEAYFGGVPADRKISYAPSFGWVNAEELHPSSMKEDLKRFDSISVRDENTRAIIEAVLGVDAPLVLDPTLIYDFSSDERSSDWPQKLGEYLLVYAYAVNKHVIEQVRKYANANGLKVVGLGYREHWCDINLMGVGPLEWLTLFKNASAVLTSTFHGAIFSVKYEKKFFYIANTKAKNRVVTLLGVCGIDTQIASLVDGQVELIQPDYKAVTPRLNAAAKESIDWLAANVSKEPCEVIV